jgi:uncharacterized membrane protein YphA (DoxX/SURF4 family)
MKRKVIVEIISVLFIILWVSAALSKLTDLASFKFQLGRSPFIQHIGTFTAITIPIAEIVIALLLVFNGTKLGGLYASFFLMLLFTGYIYMMLYQSYFIPCSCGGILKLFGLDEDWQKHFEFNIAATIIAAAGILLYEKEPPTHESNYKHPVITEPQIGTL